MIDDPLTQPVISVFAEFLGFATFLAIVGIIVLVCLWIATSYLRPRESDLYCCGCAGRECGRGCCHLSCVFHDPHAIERADYEAQWAEVLSTMHPDDIDPVGDDGRPAGLYDWHDRYDWHDFELPCNCPTENDDPGPYGHVILHDLECPNTW